MHFHDFPKVLGKSQIWEDSHALPHVMCRPTSTGGACTGRADQREAGPAPLCLDDGEVSSCGQLRLLLCCFASVTRSFFELARLITRHQCEADDFEKATLKGDRSFVVRVRSGEL